MPKPVKIVPMDKITLVYLDDNDNELRQPLSDLLAVGNPIDPETDEELTEVLRVELELG